MEAHEFEISIGRDGKVRVHVKGVKGALERDHALSKARKKLDWSAQQKLVIDPHKFGEIRRKRRSQSAACSMCGEYCAMRIVSRFLDPDGRADDACF